MAVFRTSNGTAIASVPGYVDAHNRTATEADVHPPLEGYQGLTPFGIDGFIKDVYEYALMIDFMESVNLGGPWDRMLDIGGSEGTMARLLRGEGRARSATVIDLNDFTARLPTRLFLKHWARFRAASALSRFVPRLRRVLLGEAEWRGKRLTPVYEVFGYYPPPGSAFWNLRLRAMPRLDRSIAGDVYDLNDQFDLITSFFALPYFDVERLFQKVSDLLPVGGIFYVSSDNWWFPVNSTLLVGDFPYAPQRLSRPDFRRYVEERHPHAVDDWMARYDWAYNGHQPTLDDHIETADRCGLDLIATRQLFPPHLRHFRATVPPRLLNRFTDTRLQDVLADVRGHRPDVGLADLMSSYVMAIFMKRGPRSNTLAAHMGKRIDPTVPPTP